MWALAWMKSWWHMTDDDSKSTTTMTMLQDAYNSILNNSCWVTSNTTTLQQSYLHPGELGNKLFPFSDAITTSFFPMLYKQFDVELEQPNASGGDSYGAGDTVTSLATSAAQQNSSSSSFMRLQQVHNYFEHNYGRYFDSDGDGVLDSYQYNTALPNCTTTLTAATSASNVTDYCDTGDYSIWATANLLIGMILPAPLQQKDRDFLRDIFQGTPLSVQNQNKPKVRNLVNIMNIHHKKTHVQCVFDFCRYCQWNILM